MKSINYDGDPRIFWALQSVVWYNGLSEYLLKFMDEEPTANYIHKPEYMECKEFEIIWMILVSLFGDYGTSPRSGWIYKDNWNECKKFIKMLCEIYLED